MTSTPVTIRPPAPTDKPRWFELWEGYLRFYESSVPVDRSDRLWLELLDGEDRRQCRLAEVDGEIVGMVQFHPREHTWFDQPVCYLADLYVLDSVRGRGIGRALIEEVAAIAKAEGWHHVYWQTQTFNETARKLYDAMTGGASDFIVYNFGR